MRRSWPSPGSTPVASSGSPPENHRPRTCSRAAGFVTARAWLAAPPEGRAPSRPGLRPWRDALRRVLDRAPSCTAPGGTRSVASSIARRLARPRQSGALRRDAPRRVRVRRLVVFGILRRADRPGHRVGDGLRVRTVGHAPLVHVRDVGVLAHTGEKRAATRAVGVEAVHAVGRVDAAGHRGAGNLLVHHAFQHWYPVGYPAAQGRKDALGRAHDLWFVPFRPTPADLSRTPAFSGRSGTRPPRRPGTRRPSGTAGHPSLLRPWPG